MLEWRSFTDVDDDADGGDWTDDNNAWLNLVGGPLDWPVTVWTYRVVDGLRVSDIIAHPAV